MFNVDEQNIDVDDKNIAIKCDISLVQRILMNITNDTEPS